MMARAYFLSSKVILTHNVLPAELGLYQERNAMIIALVYQVVKIRQEKCVLLEASDTFLVAKGKKRGASIEIEISI